MTPPHPVASVSHTTDIRVMDSSMEFGTQVYLCIGNTSQIHVLEFIGPFSKQKPKMNLNSLFALPSIVLYMLRINFVQTFKSSLKCLSIKYGMAQLDMSTCSVP